MLHISFAGLEQTQSNQVSYFRVLVAYVPCLQRAYLTFFFTALDVKRLGAAVKVTFFLIIVLMYTYILHGPSTLADRPILVKYSMTNPTFIGYEKTSSYWSAHFFSVFFFLFFFFVFLYFCIGYH